MDSRHSSSSIGCSRARVPQITNGDQLADRARALVDRTRAGLGRKGLAFGSDQESDGEEDVMNDEIQTDEIKFNMDFIRQLTMMHKESVRQITDMKHASEKEELSVVISGISGFLSEVSSKFPSTSKAMNRCRDVLQRFLDGGYDESRKSGVIVHDDSPVPIRDPPAFPSRSDAPERGRAGRGGQGRVPGVRRWGDEDAVDA